ncbi:tRNA (5-methylaminomethyl-2-thiouridine)(34)-methyltransferase MnmD [Haloflavibacter putidus]|uniref:tRNA (5-methylaminomethyl-2-thiouridine)(34)-methyltransferase MnmD n=1 Tax=Haloflavibacter putidus TaxID=2576776 RepID=A0A507ZSD7_9FLAO|nr:tRNA (5-methylaminomethyl-2-thiouridine)(34)-methyltransferase MnmD [Haloflavibacter putidus]TQD37745.1 tRNA (5-methylaminomethyl-2-thiouridine)(34)-methyltransferase MnmD [Haloflavibacter putidus]
MKRKIIITADGSTSIHLPEWEEQYHSKHGAIQEAKHVFLKSGLDYFVEKNPTQTEIAILEIGFGTGLNALLTALVAEKKNLQIDYTGVEAYPVEMVELEKLNYTKQLSNRNAELYFSKIHQANWEAKQNITTNFALTKQQKFFKNIADSTLHNLVYFDAFGARVQPELWEESIFEIMHNALRKNGVLVTYSAKGSARRAMQKVGFEVERIPGPPGKREMLRATKL